MADRTAKSAAEAAPGALLEKFVVELENADAPALHVDGAQGLALQRDNVKVMFYSDRMAPLERLEGKVETKPTSGGQAVDIAMLALGDPYGIDKKEVKIIRRVEAHLIFNKTSLEAIIPWLQQKLNEMKGEGRISAKK